MAAKPTFCFHALRDPPTHTHTNRSNGTHKRDAGPNTMAAGAGPTHAASSSSPGKCPWSPQQEVHHSSCLSFCTTGVEPRFNSWYVSLTWMNTTCEGQNVYDVETHNDIPASLLSLQIYSYSLERLLMILNIILLHTAN